MMYYTDDPVADFDRYDAEQEKRLAELPECDYCGEKITDDYYYNINGDVICEECLKKHFRQAND